MSTSTTLANMQKTTMQTQGNNTQVGFLNTQGFELMQRVGKALSMSELVPKMYQGNLQNCMIALDMSQRLNANPLMVMQNLYVVHGNPAWSAKFLIATINTSGKFSALRYEWKEDVNGKKCACRAWAIEKETGERLEGTWIDWGMVQAEGWAKKNGSKWVTMPDQMFVYRAASFWVRMYAPEVSMGINTVEEAQEIIDLKETTEGKFSVSREELKEKFLKREEQESSVEVKVEEVNQEQIIVQPVFSQEEMQAILEEEKREAAGE